MAPMGVDDPLPPPLEPSAELVPVGAPVPDCDVVGRPLSRLVVVTAGGVEVPAKAE